MDAGLALKVEGRGSPGKEGQRQWMDWSRVTQVEPLAKQQRVTELEMQLAKQAELSFEFEMR